MVELLSPIALPDAPASASYGFWLLALPVAVASCADRLGTIDLPYANGRLFHGRAIVPNSSTRRASVGGLWFLAVGLTGLRWLQALIDWGQSIYHTPAAAVSSLAIHSQRFLRFGPPEDLPGPLLLIGPLLNPFFGPLALPRVLCRSSEPIPPLGRPGPLCS